MMVERGHAIQSRPNARDLRHLLLRARARTLEYAHALSGAQLLGPMLAIVNPPLWEIGHVGWFQEHWCLRHRPQGERAAPLIANGDALYDSAAVPHDTRWSLPLPPLEATLGYLQRVLDLVLERLEREGATQHLQYFVQLAAFHEQMHCEAFTYTRQTLGYAGPRACPSSTAAVAAAGGPWPGDVEIAGGEFMLGAEPGAHGFVFDNEKWAHPVRVAPFRMARAAVTNAEFAAFVEDAGYRRRDLWSDAGWRWREGAGAVAPLYWERHGEWMRRRYDRLEALHAHAAVIHVNWFEADAYCRWAGRRLPTEAEWEFAASTAPGAPGAKRRFPWGDGAAGAQHANLYGVTGECADVRAFGDGDSAWGCRQLIGNVWEWTADWFAPYPGFVRDPYKEYSEPWFGDHKVLRGGCFATAAELLRNSWRNFYTPERRDVFGGFRTCAR